MLFGKSEGYVEALVFDSMYKEGAPLAGVDFEIYTRSFFFRPSCFLSFVSLHCTMKVNSFLTVSALGAGALAHPFHAPRTIKHIDKRVCGFEERNLFARADATSTATATIPKATAWNPPSGMVTALDQVYPSRHPCYTASADIATIGLDRNPKGKSRVVG